MKVAGLCRKYRILEATFYNSKAKSGIHSINETSFTKLRLNICNMIISQQSHSQYPYEPPGVNFSCYYVKIRYLSR